MARITPSSGSTIDLSELDDDEPYKGIIRKPKDGWYSKGSDQYGGEDRLTIDLMLEDGVQSVRDWLSLRLGKQQNGTVSKLRMLLNALSDKPRDTEIKWFDDVTLEWSYDGDKPFNRLTEGSEVIFRGVKGTRQDGQGKFSVQKYQTAKASSAGAKRKMKSADDEAPF